MQTGLLYFGSSVIFLWGVGHLMPTKNIVSGFGSLGQDNARILTMEWIAEGLTLCFLGVLVALITFFIGQDRSATRLIVRACAAMLLLLAGLSALTGARTSILPMKLCPWIKSAVAILFVVASVL